MTAKFEIYFSDLRAEAQVALLERFKTTKEEENWDAFPIAEIEREEEGGETVCQK